MSVFKVYYKIMKAHKSVLFIYLSIFLMVFFAFFLGAMQDDDVRMYQGKKPRVAILDRDHSDLSAHLMEHMHSYADIPYEDVSIEEAKDALFYADVSAIFTIPKGFEQDFMENKETIQLQERADDVQGVLLQQHMNAYLDTLHTYQQLYPQKQLAALQDMAAENVSLEASIAMTKSQEVVASHILCGKYFNYASYIMLAITILMIGMTMHSIFDAEIHKRNLIAPLSQSVMNLKLLICNVSVGILLWALMMLIIVCTIPERMLTSIGLLEIINAFMFMLMSVSMAFMFCVIAAKSKHADDLLNGISNIVGLGSSFLGGAFVPQSMISENILVISQFLPTYWYVKLNDALTSVTTVSAELLQTAWLTYGILLLFAIAFLCIALVIMKNRQTQSALENTSIQ